MSEVEQNFQNHAKFVPMYHMVAFPLLVINFGWSVWKAWQLPSADTVIAVTTAFAIIIVFFFARLFALKVQDRVIRLEMRLRMHQVLPAGLHPRIVEFTPKQLVALRFATDGELTGLAEAVLRDQITDQKTIKQMVKKWNSDHCRA